MMNYLIYTNPHTDEIIVEYFNEGNDIELHNIEIDLLKCGYVIIEVYGKYIKCRGGDKENKDE